MQQSHDEYDAVIIGGGLSGLTCALSLLNQGKKVHLVERTPMVGGCQGYFKRKGFLFDACLHSVAEAYDGGPVVTALQSLGLPGLPDFVRMDPAACFVFPDTTYRMPADGNASIKMLSHLFPGEAAGIEKLFAALRDVYQGLGKLPDIDPAVERYSGAVFQQVLDEFITDGRLQAVVSGYWGYLGLPPSRSSALVFSAFTHSLFAKGNFFPRGGVSTVVRLLEGAIRKKGGELSMNSAAQKIIVKQNKAAGVLLDSGREISAKTVVSNADAGATFFDLLGKEHLQPEFINSIEQLKTSLSAFSVYLGIERGLSIPQTLSGTNLVYPDNDLDRQYEALCAGRLENVPYCLAIPTLQNPLLAPTGRHIVNLYTPIPYRTDAVAAWKEKKQEYTEKFIDLAETVLPGLRRHIVVTEAATPDTLVRYSGNRNGAVGGWDYTPATDAGRLLNKTPVEGLYLTGHWTFPGVGVHAAIQSGCITASMIE